jgi:hypothetical protein
MDYTLATLLPVLRVQHVPTTFWLETFFKKQINFDTEKIEFDKVNDDYRRLAPFVAPNVQGKVLSLEGYETVAFKPAYVKPKHVISPNEVAFVRRPGEAPGVGSMSPQARKDAVVADILLRHRHMHTLRQEWMAAKAVIDGSVTISGEDYPTTTVDFRRDASLSAILAGAAKWDVGTATPLADIYDMRSTANALSGAVIRDIIFGQDAWGMFSGFAAVQALLNNQVRGSDTNFTKLSDAFEDSVEYVGTLVGVNGAGLVRMWVYSGKYKDEAGTLQDIMDSKTVVGVDGGMLDGHRCFGAIQDFRAGLQSLELFPKVWQNEDPSVEYLMTQSAPLMIPKQPNASFKIKVA